MMTRLRHFFRSVACLALVATIIGGLWAFASLNSEDAVTSGPWRQNAASSAVQKAREAALQACALQDCESDPLMADGGSFRQAT